MLKLSKFKITERLAKEQIPILFLHIGDRCRLIQFLKSTQMNKKLMKIIPIPLGSFLTIWTYRSGSLIKARPFEPFWKFAVWTWLATRWRYSFKSSCQFCLLHWEFGWVHSPPRGLSKSNAPLPSVSFSSCFLSIGNEFKFIISPLNYRLV